MRLPSASRWAGRSVLPLSSEASISTTQRAVFTPRSFSARTASSELNTAYPSSAPPRP